MAKINKNIERISSLDGLRGYAALMVLCAHIPKLSNHGGLLIFNDLTKSLNIGYFGVDVFFILSGYLITRNLCKYEMNLTALKSFYFNRALRIFPIYYLTLFFTILFINSSGWLCNILYLSNYYFTWIPDAHPMRHAWSLAVEEHFYVVWPFLFYLLPKNNRNQWIITAIFILFVISIIYFVSVSDRQFANDLLYRGTQYRFISLALGGLIAINEYKRNFNFRHSSNFYLFSFFISYIIYLLCVENNYVQHLNLFNYFTFPILGTLLFIIAVTARNKWGKVIFENAPITFIGSISYGLYLYHFPVFYMFGMTSQQTKNQIFDLSIALLALIIVFLIATLSSFFIEDKILKNRISIPSK